MSVRMRHTKGHTRNRRSHHGLKAPRLTRDTETNSYHLRHRVDMKTGMYRGKKVLDVAATTPTAEAKEPAEGKATGEKQGDSK